MTIHYVKGDAVKALLDGEITYLIHCTNCQNCFGSGIAKQIREQCPDAFVQDCRLAEKGWNKLGAYIDSDEGVINLYGQEYFGTYGEHYKRTGRQVNYGAISKGFYDIVEFLGNPSGLKIGFPYKMACDRAGGDWNIVLEMIEFHFKDYDVYIYSLEG